MTWDDLTKKIDEYLAEAGGHVNVAADLIAEGLAKGDILEADALTMGLVLLSLAVSNLHSAMESVAVGLGTVKAVLSDHITSEEVHNVSDE